MNMNTPFLDRISGTKLGFRINILAMVAVLATLVLSASFFYGDRIMTRESQIQLQYSHLEDLVEDVEIGALQMRRREKDFLLRKDVKYIKKYDTAEKAVDQALEKIAGLAVSAPVLENVKRLKANITRHKEQFYKVSQLQEAIGLNEKLGFSGVLRNAVHAVEVKLKAANLDKLTIKILMMRRHEKDFMMRGTEKYIARIDSRRQEFDALLKKTALPDSVRAELTTLMDAYQNGFKAYAKTALALKPETKMLSTIFADMAPDFEALFKASKAGKQKIEATLTASRDLTRTIFLGSAIVVLIIATGLGLLIGRSITTPIRNLTAAMQKLVAGDTSVDVPNSKDKNGIGDMARAVEIFKENMIRNKELEADVRERQLKVTERATVIEQLNEDFDSEVSEVLAGLASATEQLNETATSMSSASEETQAQSGVILTASDESMRNIQSVVSATEELSASIEEIGRQTIDSSSMSRRAVESAEGAKTQVTQLVEHSQKIGDVVSLISDIAEQTNLLALNATIEAARAGEMGKGFAVVASEVKSLASQTAKATEDIGAQIEAMQGMTTGTATAIEDIVAIINSVDEVINAIAGGMDEQNSATQEISQSIQLASRGAQEITSNVNGVNEAANSSSQLSTFVLEAAEDLTRQSGQLRRQIDGFLDAVRAA